MNLMSLFSFGGAETYCGLDVGNSSIKIVRVKKTKTGPQLIGYGMVEVPDDVMAEGNIADPSGLASAIKDLLKEHKASGDKMVAGISAQNVIVRFIDMPEIPDEDMEETIKFEAEQYVPYAMDEMAISFAKLEKIDKGGGEFQQKVLLVVAQKDFIHSITTMLKEAGVTPEVLDTDTFGALNALEGFLNKGGAAGAEGEEGEEGEEEVEEEMEEDEVVAVIDIGARTTNINILKSGILQFTRNIPMAGNNITTVIQNILKLEMDQAEDVKRKEGISGIDEDEEESDVTEVVRTIVEELASEVRRSFDYYKAQTREAFIHRIVVTGGTANLKNIGVFLTNELGIDVELGNPLVGLNLQLNDEEEFHEHIHELTVAIGLALRGSAGGEES